MRDGTRKMFPTQFEDFKKAMLTAARENQLPVKLKLGDISDYSLKDVEDMFGEFSQETGLSILGSLSYNSFDEELYFLVKVDKPSPLALRSSVLQ